MGVFIDPEELANVQLVQVFLAYSYLLYVGCNMISDGAELLMLTPFSKVVGCCILPILGAVPDGAIVLFSGLGPDAQENLDVGVGALAGSTVMLLTIPWGMAIFGGRVSLGDDGRPVYDVPKGVARYTTDPAGVLGAGPKVRKMALWMAATAVPYVVVEGGALLAEARYGRSSDALGDAEGPYALAALVLSAVGFVLYLVAQYKAAYGGEKNAVLNNQIRNATAVAVAYEGVGLIAALAPHLRPPADAAQAEHYAAIPADGASGISRDKLKLLRRVLGPYFSKYDNDASGYVDVQELGRVFEDMNEPKSQAEVVKLFAAYDANGDQKLTLDEFCVGMYKYAGSKPRTDPGAPSRTEVDMRRRATGDPDDDDDEKEEYPEEFAEHKYQSVADQQTAIRKAAAKLCLLGTALVLVFSDPITDVLNTVADRIGVPPFYVGFVVAPVITNGSEVLASYTFALKKTRSSMVVAYEQLLGAAVMNNTFCLSVFAALIYFKDLKWTYTAETAAILGAELAMFLVATKLEIHTTKTAALVISIYPAALTLVWVMENVFGLS